MDGLSLDAMMKGFTGGQGGLGSTLASIYRTDKLSEQMAGNRDLMRDNMVFENSRKLRALGQQDRVLDQEATRIENQDTQFHAQLDVTKDLGLKELEILKSTADAQNRNMDATTAGELIKNADAVIKQRGGLLTNLIDQVDKAGGIANLSAPEKEALASSLANLYGGPQLVSTRKAAKPGAAVQTALNPETNTLVFGFQNPGEQPVPLTQGETKWNGDGTQKAIHADADHFLTKALSMAQYEIGNTKTQNYRTIGEYQEHRERMNVTLQNEVEKENTPTRGPNKAALADVKGLGLGTPPAQAPNPVSRGAYLASLDSAQGPAAAANAMEGQAISEEGQRDSAAARKVNFMTPGEKATDASLGHQANLASFDAVADLKKKQSDKDTQNLFVAGRDFFNKQIHKNSGLGNRMKRALIGDDTAWYNEKAMFTDIATTLRDPEQRKVIMDTLGVDITETGAIPKREDAYKIIEFLAAKRSQGRYDTTGAITFPAAAYNSAFGDQVGFGRAK